MQLKKVEIHNFLSLGDIVIDLDSFSGLCAIEGINKDCSPARSNGTGKSSIIDAIVFALFGKTLRKTRESSIIRNGANSCSVKAVLDFNGDSVVIERGRRPSRLFFSINGSEKSRESALETQKFIEEYLNIDYTTFTTAIMFGQRNSSNFITANPADKRKILQTFLGINDYFSIREIINKKKKDLNAIKRTKIEVYDAVRKDVTILEGKIKQQKEFDKLNDIPNAEEQLQQIYYRDSWNRDQQKIKNSIAQVEKELLRLKSREEILCKSCNQVIPSDNVSELIASYEKELSGLKGELVNFEPSIPITHSQEEVEAYIYKLKFDNSLVVLEELHKNKLLEQDTLDEEIKQLTKTIEKYQYWEAAFSEQGIVKYIIRNIIDFFNNRASYYLSLLTNGHLTVTFDQQLNEIVFSGKELVEYDAMSGGETKSIQIAVMLALHDLLQFNGKSTPDFLFMDEITEIDKQGLRSVASLMQTLSDKLGKKVVLITHNSDLMSELKVNTLITLEKKKGKTTIKSVKNG